MNIQAPLVTDLEKHLGTKKVKISEDRQIYCERTIVSICNDADELAKIVKFENPVIGEPEIDALKSAITKLQTVVLLRGARGAA